MEQNIIKRLSKNGPFIFLTLTLTCYQFNVANVQFWMSDYFIEVLGATKEHTFVAFATCCITAPVVGLIAGNKIVTALGGYEGKHTFAAMLAICWVGCFMGMPVPFIESFEATVIVVWLQLSMGSIVYSNFTGVLMTLVSSELRPQAFALVQFSYNLFGFMPAPYLYGLVVKATETPEQPSRYGMVLTFWIQIPACLLCSYSYYKKCKAEKAKSQKYKQALIDHKKKFEGRDTGDTGPLHSIVKEQEQV